MAFCPNCGTKVESAHASFCTNCGAKLGSEGGAQKPTPATYQAPAGAPPAPSGMSGKRKGAPVPPVQWQGGGSAPVAPVAPSAPAPTAAPVTPSAPTAAPVAPVSSQPAPAPAMPCSPEHTPSPSSAPNGAATPAVPAYQETPSRPSETPTQPLGQPGQTLEASAQGVCGQQGGPSVPQDLDTYSNMAAAEKLLGDESRQAPAQPQKTAFSKNIMRLVIVLFICLVFVLALVLIFKFAFPSGTQESNPAPAPSEQSQAPAQNQDSSTQALNPAEVPVKSSISQYSWDEIGAISSLISDNARSKAEAIKIAAKYNLCMPDGTLKNDVITVNYIPRGGGEPIKLGFLLVGIFQDQRPQGGPAPFSFMCTQAIGEDVLQVGDKLHFTSGVPMNLTNTNAGGWEASFMRSWLNRDVLAGLEPDLQAQIKPVIKLTNNTGQTKSPASVTSTLDSLYLFSWKELLGDIAWNRGVSTSYIDQVDNAEGLQYDYFVQQGVRGEQGAPVLRRPIYPGIGMDSTYWMRSSAPNTATSFGDMGPTLNNGGLASTPEFVVFGFCV